MVADQDRVVELARMLAGMDSTETGRAHAEELLAVAEADKARGKRKPARRKRRGDAVELRSRRSAPDSLPVQVLRGLFRNLERCERLAAGLPAERTGRGGRRVH